jgi:hypothetical protein
VPVTQTLAVSHHHERELLRRSLSAIPSINDAS